MADLCGHMIMVVVMVVSHGPELRHEDAMEAITFRRLLAVC